MWEPSKDVSAREMAVAARECPRRPQVSYQDNACWKTQSASPLFFLNILYQLWTFMKQNLSSDERKKILLDVADALEENEDLIRTENEAYVAAAQDDGGSPLLS